MELDARACAGPVQVLETASLTMMREILKRIATTFRKEQKASVAEPQSWCELHSAIDAARFSMREPTEEGPRVIVMSGSLLGMFLYTREEAERRIRKAFPEVDDRAVMRGLRHLENRIALYLRPVLRPSRKQSRWVHGWKAEEAGFR